MSPSWRKRLYIGVALSGCPSLRRSVMKLNVGYNLELLRQSLKLDLHFFWQHGHCDVVFFTLMIHLTKPPSSHFVIFLHRTFLFRSWIQLILLMTTRTLWCQIIYGKVIFARFFPLCTWILSRKLYVAMPYDLLFLNTSASNFQSTLLMTTRTYTMMPNSLGQGHIHYEFDSICP